MFSFFKKKKKKTSLPEWAPFDNGGMYKLFIQEIAKYFNQKKIDHTINEGVVKVNDENLNINNLGLQNIAQICHQNTVDRYPTLIKNHFDTMLNIESLNDNFKEAAKNFEYAKNLIGVRLYPTEQMQVLPEDVFVARPVTDNLHAVLVFDLPETIQNITPSEANLWNKSKDELFELGMDNIRRKYDLSPEENIIADTKMWVLSSDNFFAANLIMDLEKYQGLIGPHGSLFIVPVRNVMIVYPITDNEVIMAIHALIPIVQGMFKDGPGSLSEDLCWYNDGKIETQAFELADGKITFQPTVAFVEMLQAINSNNQEEQ